MPHPTPGNSPDLVTDAFAVDCWLLWREPLMCAPETWPKLKGVLTRLIERERTRYRDPTLLDCGYIDYATSELDRLAAIHEGSTHDEPLG